MNKLFSFISEFFSRYTSNRISRASAALAYFLTLTFFPLLICVYYMLGQNADEIMSVLVLLENFMAEETVEATRAFFSFIADHNSPAMIVAGATILLTSASAAVRSIQFTIGDIQGRLRFKSYYGFLISIAVSLLYVFVLYLGIIVVMSGKAVIAFINSRIQFIDISSSWNYIRFIIFAALLSFALYSIYWICRDKNDHYSLWPGVLVSAVGTIGIGMIFSMVLGASIRYPLVYGSIASIILLMMWIYFFAISMYCGALLNVMIRDKKSPE